MGSGSWRRRGESLEADSFWSLPSYLGTVVLGFCLEGVCAVCCFFTSISRFFGIIASFSSTV